MIDPEEILSLPLNNEERGLHVTLIALQVRDGELPGTIPELAEKVRMLPDRFGELWQRVGMAFELRSGHYVHPSTADKLAKRRKVSAKRSEAAKAKWAKVGAAANASLFPAPASIDSAHAGENDAKKAGAEQTPLSPVSPLAPSPHTPLPVIPIQPLSLESPPIVPPDSQEAPAKPKRKLSDHQLRVKAVEDAIVAFGEKPPAPALIAKWIAEFGGIDEILAAIHDIGPPGHLAKGTPYLYRVIQGKRDERNSNGSNSGNRPAAPRETRRGAGEAPRPGRAGEFGRQFQFGDVPDLPDVDAGGAGDLSDLQKGDT